MRCPVWHPEGRIYVIERPDARPRASCLRESRAIGLVDNDHDDASTGTPLTTTRRPAPTSTYPTASSCNHVGYVLECGGRPRFHNVLNRLEHILTVSRISDHA